MRSLSVRSIWVHLVVLALAVATFGDSAASAKSAARSERLRRLDARLRVVAESGTDQPQRVIIRVAPGMRGAMRRALSEHGDTVLADHASAEALTAVVHADDLEALAAAESIVSVSVDAVVRPHGLLGGLLGGLVEVATGLVGGLLNTVGTILDPADMSGPPVPPQVLRDTLGVDSSLSGRGVGVAVVDSGVEYSSDFDGRIMAFYDFTNGRAWQTSPSDGYGHGTHVAATIAGTGAMSYRRDYRGLAPDARLLVLKVLDANGAGFTSDVIRAIDFAVANRSRYNIRIINLSLGHPIYEPASSDPLVQAVERASRAGIIVVAAAGNQGKNKTTGLPGYAGTTSPGNAPSAITAGAVQTLDTVARSDDRIPDYSSAGPTWFDARVKPDFLAPGHNIVATGAKRSTIYKNYPQLRAPDADYIRLSGTSMATAVASGVIALALEAHRDTQGSYAPRPTPNAVKAALQYSAFDVHNDLGIEYDPLRQGAGALNGDGAIALIRAMDTSTRVGDYWLSRTPSPWTRIGDDWLPWQQEIIWGNAVIWGSTVAKHYAAWDEAVIWGSTDEAVIWGSNDDAVIWGSSDLVWTDPHSWATAVIWGSDSIGTRSTRYEDEAVIWGSTDGMSKDNTVWKTPAQ
jgi:serine protease AprX